MAVVSLTSYLSSHDLFPSWTGEITWTEGIMRKKLDYYFQRRHYKKIAEGIGGLVKDSDLTLDDLLDVIGVLCQIFEQDNTRFNEEKFVEACGISWCLYTGDFFRKEKDG